MIVKYKSKLYCLIGILGCPFKKKKNLRMNFLVLYVKTLRNKVFYYLLIVWTPFRQQII